MFHDVMHVREMVRSQSNGSKGSADKSFRLFRSPLSALASLAIFIFLAGCGGYGYYDFSAPPPVVAIPDSLPGLYEQVRAEDSDSRYIYCMGYAENRDMGDPVRPDRDLSALISESHFRGNSLSLQQYRCWKIRGHDILLIEKRISSTDGDAPNPPNHLWKGELVKYATATDGKSIEIYELDDVKLSRLFLDGVIKSEERLIEGNGKHRVVTEPLDTFIAKVTNSWELAFRVILRDHARSVK